MVKWQAFFISNNLTRTIVHFFPEAKGSFVPYPVESEVSVFGDGISPKSIKLEGARIGSPDGISVEQAFSELNEMKNDAQVYSVPATLPNVFGIEVALSSSQPNLDLSPSACIIEISTGGHCVKFRPKRITTEKGDAQPRLIPIDGNKKANYSLLVVNGSASECKPQFSFYSANRNLGPVAALVPDVKPKRVLEKSLMDFGFITDGENDLESGITGGIALESGLPAEVACYLISKDTATQRLNSVHAL